MIFDHISNISLYKTLSPDIYAGLAFLKDVKPDIAPGTYQLTPRVKAIVSEYETKVKNEVGYEAHRKNYRDGHMPQLSVGEPEMVKKVVVKVEI